MEFEKIKDVIAAQMGIEKDLIAIDTIFTEDLGIDSLDIYIITQELETIFDIEFSNEQAESIKTVGDLVTYVKNQ